MTHRHIIFFFSREGTETPMKNFQFTFRTEKGKKNKVFHHFYDTYCELDASQRNDETKIRFFRRENVS